MFEILIAQAILAKMSDQLSQLDIGQRVLADFFAEIDVRKDAIQPFQIGFFEIVFRFVESVTDVLMERVVDVPPTRDWRHKETLIIAGIFGFRLRFFFCFGRRDALPQQGRNLSGFKSLAFGLKYV